MRFDTRLAQATEPDRPGEQPASPPVWLTSEYAYDDLEQYAESIDARHGDAFVRGAGPTNRRLHGALAALEGGEAAWAFPGGMAAIRAVFAILVQRGARAHVIAQRTLYGGTVEFLRELDDAGIAVSWVDPTAEAVSAELRSDTRLVFVEGLANPTMEVAAVRGIGRVCEAAGTPLVVDNSLATPVLQRPIESLPSAVTVHSTTKYLSGHSDVVGGAAIGRSSLVSTLEAEYLRAGAHTSAFDAFLILRGLQTLAVRIRRQCATAIELAHVLAGHPRVEYVSYPGLPDSPDHGLATEEFDAGLFGPVLSFVIAGAYEEAVAFSRKLRIVRVISSFGGVHTALCHPASTSHRQLTQDELLRARIHPNLLRLALGLEDPADLAEDLDAALSSG